MITTEYTDEYTQRETIKIPHYKHPADNGFFEKIIWWPLYAGQTFSATSGWLLYF